MSRFSDQYKTMTIVELEIERTAIEQELRSRKPQYGITTMANDIARQIEDGAPGDPQANR